MITSSVLVQIMIDAGEGSSRKKVGRQYQPEMSEMKQRACEQVMQDCGCTFALSICWCWAFVRFEALLSVEVKLAYHSEEADCAQKMSSL